MRHTTALLAILVGLAVAPMLPGCATAPAQPAAGGTLHAECTVCKHNADLACIDVPVEADTPRVQYEGKTYYFCSEHCAKKFQQDPAKYAKE